MKNFFINENLEVIENGEGKAQSALDLFEKGLTKTEIKTMAAAAVESVLINGNPLTVAEALSAMELFIKEVKAEKKFTDYVREEAIKTPKGFISKSGAKIEIAETGSAYDFAKCGDPVLMHLQAQTAHFAALMQERKDFLKNLPLSGVDVLIDDEVVKVYPPSKSSTSSYKITLAK